MKLRHIVYFLILSLFWGGSFLAIHYVVKDIPPAFGAFLRVSIGLLAVGILILFQERSDTTRNIKLQAFGSGIFNLGIPWLLLFYAERLISPAMGAIYNSTTAIFIAIFTPIFLSSSGLDRKNIMGILIGFIGILVVFGPSVSAHDMSQAHTQIALIGMAACYAIGTVWIKRFSKQINIIKGLFYQMLGGFVVLGIYSILFDAPWNIDLMNVSFEAYISVLYLGICSTFLGWLIYISLIHEIGTVQSAAIFYMIPLVSIALDWLFLSKMVKTTDIIGLCVIFAGVWLIQRRHGVRLDVRA